MVTPEKKRQMAAIDDKLLQELIDNEKVSIKRLKDKRKEFLEEIAQIKIGLAMLESELADRKATK